MKKFNTFGEFIQEIRSFTQKDLSYMLYVIVNNMENLGLEYSDLYYQPIEVLFSDSHVEVLKFNYEGAPGEQLKQNDLNKEKNKILEICGLILYCLVGRQVAAEELYKTFMIDNIIVKEFKVLLKVAMSPSSFMTFKMFCKRIKEIYNLFTLDNLFNVDYEKKKIEEQKLGSGIERNIEDKIKLENVKKEVVSRISLIACNCCGFVSLEPIYKLDQCGCYFHKECLGNTIIETIEKKELNSNFELAYLCPNPDKHLHGDDLKIIAEIERGRFTLSRPIKMMIRFYYLNINEDASSYCNCNKVHKKVDMLSKKPYRLCNARCSFCGERYKEICPKFMKSLNWSY